ncbi:MAG: alpha/beta hydrolase [Ferruginibacter sp.]
MNAEKIIKVYFISGLAADRRAFQFINLPEGFETVYLDWQSFHKGESMQSYAWRLAEKIDTTNPFVLLGLSMGGMLATEIAKIYKPLLTILISSVPVSTSLPNIYKLAALTKIYRVIPGGWLKSASLAKRLFARETKEVKAILRQIIKDSDPKIIRDAVHAIVTWENTWIPPNLLHIHGTKDELLPYRKVNALYNITGGSHLMVLSQAKEINIILHEALSGLKKGVKNI